MSVQSVYTRAITLHEVGAGRYDIRFEQLPKRNVSLSGWLQSYKYFEQVEDQLRVDFTFQSSVLEPARRWLEKQTPERWRTERKTFVRVLIHVRRKDHISSKLVRMGYTSPTLDYFRRAMSYFTECLERVLFVVLSDDMKWCMRHLIASHIVYSRGHSPIVDLAISSLCDHAIITVGSYSWWAAWFANGITITQKNYPRNGSAITSIFRREDHYKPEWIGL